MKLFPFSSTTDQKAFAQTFSQGPSLRRSPYDVGTLPPELLRQFLHTAPADASEFWIVEEESGKLLGTVGASLMPTYPGQGAIGFFEVSEDKAPQASAKLLEAAALWLKSKGCHTAIGPMNLSSWFPYRFRTNFEDSQYFSWEPNNPPHYPTLWKDSGFLSLQGYHSTGVGNLSALVTATEESFSTAKANGYGFRSFDPERVLEREVPILYRLSMGGFSKNFLFEPISEALFTQLYVPIAKKMDFSYAFFVTDSTDKEVGFFFC